MKDFGQSSLEKGDGKLTAFGKNEENGLEVLIFIDESGDTGFKFEKGSSRYVVVVLVSFEDTLDAEEVSLKIKRLKRKLGWGEATEFKFSGTSNRFRREFFEVVKGCPFRFVALAVDKTEFVEGRLQGRRFYDYVLAQSFSELLGLSGEATVYFDKMVDKSFVLSFNTCFRKIFGGGKGLKIKRIKHRRSTSNNLIQLADMISGAVFRKYEKGEDIYYNQIKDRCF